jgi:hypothetical protein
VAGERRAKLVALLVFLGLALVFTGPAILGAKTIFFGDIFFFEQPRDQLLAASLRAGEGIPRWMPGVWGGAPALGAQEMALLYPPNVVLALLAGIHAQAIGLLLHLVLAAFGARAVASRLALDERPALLAGIAYAFGGALLSAHIVPVYVRSAAWLPWLLAGLLDASRGERRGIALATLALVATYLAGDPLGCVVGSLAALLVVFAAVPGGLGRGVVALAVSGVAALVLAAAQLLPALGALHESARQGGIGFSFAGRWSLWPTELLGLAVPFLFGSLADPASAWYQAVVPASPEPPIHDRAWNEACYLGPIVLALAVAGLTRVRRSPGARAGLALAAAFTFLALGRFNLAYQVIFDHVPGVSVFRFPAKLFLPASLGLSLLAASGLEDLARDRRARIAALPALALLALAGVVGAIALGSDPAAFGAAIDARAQERHLASISGTKALEALAPRLGHVAVLALGGLAILLGASRRPRRVALALLALATLDLAIALRPAIFLAPVAELEREPRVAPVIAGIAREDATPARTITTEDALKPTPDDRAPFAADDRYAPFFLAWTEALKPNVALAHGLLSQQGFLSSTPLRAARLENLRRVAFPRLAVLRGARFVVASEKELDLFAGEATPVATMGPRVLLALDKAPPWAGLYGRVRAASSMKAAIAAIASPTFDPRRETVLETSEPLAPVDEDARPASIQGTLGRTRFEVAVDPVHPSWLVVREAYALGWSAEVDGVAAPVVPADGLFRAVPVPAGAKLVVFSYDAPHGTLGAVVSALALALGALAARYFASR